MDREIKAMQQVLSALQPLDYWERVRVVRWVVQRMELPFQVPARVLDLITHRHMALAEQACKVQP